MIICKLCGVNKEATLSSIKIKLDEIAALRQQITTLRQSEEYAWKNTRAIEAHYAAVDKKQREQILELEQTIAALQLDALG